MTSKPLPIVRAAYYAFILSIPIETLDIGIDSGNFSLSKIVGYLFMLAACLQPHVCFKKPPKPLLYFVLYTLAYAGLGVLQPEYVIWPFTMGLFRLIQMLLLFWISYSLLQYQDMIKGTFLAFGASCVLLSMLLIGGVGSNLLSQGRVSALSQDANTLASVLALGAIALLGLAYSRADYDPKISLFIWMCLSSLTIGIVMTGSRGAALSFIAGTAFLVTRTARLSAKHKIRMLVVLLIGFLAVTSYQSVTVRDRWERAWSKGNLAGREKVMPEAWQMFIERPWAGWGPVSHHIELGARFLEPSVDTHNLYLWLLTETGLLGSVPFFMALWLCWRAAWTARKGPEGSLPIALLGCLLVVNMSITWHNRKIFWLLLAYAVASSQLSSLSHQWITAGISGRFGNRHSMPAPLGVRA